MKTALLRVKFQVMAGLVLTAAAGFAAFVWEKREIDLATERLVTTQLGEIEERFALADAELDSTAALIGQARPPIQMVGDYIGKLPLSKARNVPWIWIYLTTADQGTSVESALRSELGNPKFTIDGRTPDSSLLAPVVMVLGDVAPKVVGANLMSNSNIARILSSAQVGTVSEPHEPLAVIEGDGFPANTFYMLRRLSNVRDGAGALRSSVIFRGITAAAIRRAAGLTDNQAMKIVDRYYAEARTVLQTNAAPTEEWFRQASFGVGRSQFDVWLGKPQDEQGPWWWLTVLALGTLTTGFYATLRSGWMVGQRAQHLDSVLSSTEHALEETQRREAAFFENTGTANCETDFATGRLLRVNEAFVSMLGYSREELSQKRFIDITHPDDIEPSKDALKDGAGDLNSNLQFEKRYIRKDGSPVWALVNAKLYRDATGVPTSYMTVILNIDDKKRDEATKALLARELAHRVRNTVQLTSSLARQTAATARSVKEYDTKFHRRLAALSAAQDILFDRNWVSASLSTIAQGTLRPFAPEEETPARLAIDLPDVDLPTQQAQTIAVALHELASNSSHFGALSNGGKVAVTGTLIDGEASGPRKLHLRWEESSTKPIRKPRRSGFGTRMLMQALPEQFGGHAKASWRRNGYLYEAWLTMPVV